MSAMRTLTALFGAPLLWVVQMSLSEALAAYACYPHQAPLAAPVWSSLVLMLAGISLICLIGALLSGFTAWSLWRQAEQERKFPGTDKNRLADAQGRRRFLARLGMMSSLLFIIATLFTGCAIIFVSPCSSWF
ncbi:hypothetical protein [Candidatus Methylobacter favarea]|nr:hypothetical protein [Candidatus Methylobacter favarea]